MEVDWMRITIGVVIGGGLGIVIMLGMAATQHLLRGRSTDSAGKPQMIEARRRPVIRLSIGAAIVLVSAAIFAVIGDRGKPVPPELPASSTMPSSAANSTPAPAPDAQIDVGGVTLTFAPPAGYCFYPDPIMQSALSAQKKINRDNVVYTIFGDCDQLRAAAGAGARIHDFGMLMAPAAFMSKTMSRTEFDQIAHQSVDPVTVKKTIDQRIKDARIQLEMQSFSSLGILERDDGALYLGTLSKIQMSGESFDQASITGMTVIRGKLIFYCLYGDYGRDPRPVLQRLLNRAKAGVDAFAKLNQ